MSLSLQSKTQETIKSVREKLFSETAKIAKSVEKIRSACNGYHRIQPQILPKGLNTLRPQNTTKQRKLSFDSNSNLLFDQQRQYHSLPFLNYENCIDGTNNSDETTVDVKESDYLLPAPPNSTSATDNNNNNLHIISPNKKRRNSKSNTKIVITSNDEFSNPKILPGVLLTYNKEHMNLSDSNPKLFRTKMENRIHFLHRSTDSINSVEV